MSLLEKKRQEETPAATKNIANVRVNSYDPDGDPKNAQRMVGEAIVEALKEIDLKKNLSVRAAAEAMDYTCWMMLSVAAAKGGIYPPQMKTMGEVLANARHISAISRLLELGALRTNYLRITPELLADKKDEPAENMLKYELTQFGNVLLEHVVSEIGMLAPEIQQDLKDFFETIDKPNS